jgi:DNA-binding NtrC family response regulator
MDHCWQQLLKGDGAPWMALGSMLFDRPTRTRWIPLLAAVTAAGRLELPPFLDALVPSWLRHLPQGWWAYLLARTTPTGRLLPEGPPPEDFPWSLLEPASKQELEPLLLRHPPRSLTPPQLERWAVRLSPEAWMLDPRLRAWGQGYGIGAATLAQLVPPSMALGDPPSGTEAEALADPATEDLPCPGQSHGHPLAGATDHPGADPFHWLRSARQAPHPEAALRSYLWAWGHFHRLGSSGWVRRLSGEAAQVALAWGDLPLAEAWRSRRGPLESPLQELEEAEVTAARGDWEAALAKARRLTRQHPDLPGAWYLYAQGALLLERQDGLQECLQELLPDSWRETLQAALGLPARMDDLDPTCRMLRALHPAPGGAADGPGFWSAWEGCPRVPLRVEAALRRLERRPDQRTGARMLELQRLVDRTASASFQVRLTALKPGATPVPPADPLRMVEDWLQRRPRPTWLAWGSPERPNARGAGPQPPPGLLSRLHEQGFLEPTHSEGILWWGHALLWDAHRVGAILMAVDPGTPMEVQPEVQLIAPWLARLMPAAPPTKIASLKHLLTDGSEPMATVITELVRVAPSELPVLILGPTGSGKELTARELHDHSGRKGPFRPINCSEYAETLLETELFGHTKGAFTGADRDRKGAIENTEGGTLFLDEVADLSPRLQSLFLRVLQEKEIRRVGGDRTLRVNVRFLAATHRSLEEMVATGQFRKDLYYRLKGVVIILPALKDRRHEFPSLLPRLTARIAQEAGLPVPELSHGLTAALARHPWPGNFRELRHAIESALLRSTDGVLKASHFPELQAPMPVPRSWDEATRGFQRHLLLDTLHQHRFQVTDAAQRLGLTRPALYLAARRLGLDLVAERERWQTLAAPLQGL